MAHSGVYGIPTVCAVEVPVARSSKTPAGGGKGGGEDRARPRGDPSVRVLLREPALTWILVVRGERDSAVIDGCGR